MLSRGILAQRLFPRPTKRSIIATTPFASSSFSPVRIGFTKATTTTTTTTTPSTSAFFNTVTRSTTTTTTTRKRRGKRTLMMSSQSAGAGRNENDDPLTQYIILRRDLWREKSWPLGSICAQVAHASVAALETYKSNESTKAYVSKEGLPSMTKVVLEVKGEAQLLNLSEKLTENNVDHYVWREQPEDYVTCVALRPYPKDEVKGFLKKCNLASDVRSGGGEA